MSGSGTGPVFPFPKKARTPPSAARGIKIGSTSTEQGVARAFVAAHADLLRFDHTRGKWLVWEDHSWRVDDKRVAFRWALYHCHAIDASKRTLNKASFASAIETITRALEPVATASCDWEPDTGLAACPGGVIELATGVLRPGRASDMIDRRLSVTPNLGGAYQPPAQWFAFLDKIFQGDGAVIDFLQRWFGYCLSGDISEHKFLFLYGEGGNGKGTLLNSVQRIMGGYAATAAIDTFLESKFDRHPAELAALHGVHFLTINETRQGRVWNEARLKTLTGGDTIPARFMRQNPFNFFPRFKATFSGNHQPNLTTVDEAISRRIMMLKCAVEITPQERDYALPDKLRAEYPDILAWMVEGYRKWTAIGLRPPQAIIDTTTDYLHEQNLLAEWFDERCEVSYGNISGVEIFRDWVRWMRYRNAEEFAGSMQAFYANLRGKLKLSSDRKSGSRDFHNIRLKPLP